MKIGIDIRTLMDPLHSGVPEYTLNLLEALFKVDKKHEYILFYNSWSDINTIPQFNFDNVKTIKTQYPNKLFNNIMQKICRYPKLNELVGADIFFMPNIGFVSLSNKSKNIITIHDLSFLRFSEFYSFKRQLWHKMINIKKLLRQFDAVAAVSHNTKKDLIELCGLPEDKITVIYNGIKDDYLNCEFDAGFNRRVIKKYKLPEKYLLYLGTIEPRKNIEGLIEAFELVLERNKAYREYQLIIAGGKGWRYKRIFEKWRKSKYRKYIRFIGYVEPAEKKYLYKNARLFVYPSFYEGFGFPPVEAIACNTPTICSYSSSLSEAARGRAVLINPHNTREISEAVIQGLQCRPAKAIDGEFAKIYSWERTAREYLKIFTK